MFSPVIERALAAAIAAHHGQVRKGIEATPYVVHPLHVALILARWGMDDDVIVAGLLHDTVEDRADRWTPARVEQEYGAHVAGLVAQLTEDKSKSWEERKRFGIDHVPHMSPQAATVKAADKLHNLQTLVIQLRSNPDATEVWAGFRGGRERTLSMSSELVEALCKRVEPKVARALRAALKTLLDADAATFVARPLPRPSAPVR
jgi:(p)ppGpp synthase/HD superfamily hydrolase